MNANINIKKKFSTRSPRVKCVDLHHDNPWILSSLYDGKITIYNYLTDQLFKSIDVTNVPIRAARFICRKAWIVCGSDDKFIRVYNYNTLEKIHEFEAHVDYIRSIDVHPSLPLILTSSDDLTIKLWNWEKNWSCQSTYEGHIHYVMMARFNPKDPNTFSSASLDKTIKIWSIGNKRANFTLQGHTKGINSVEYYRSNDKPYLISASDDRKIKIWDYHNKTCVHTIASAHEHNISFATFVLNSPFMLTGSEDGYVNLYNSNTFKFIKRFNYSMDRAWCVAYNVKQPNIISIGFEEGTVLISLGNESPTASMDTNGKIICALNSEILSMNINKSQTTKDNTKQQLQKKNLGPCEIFPQNITHSPNNRFVAVCSGDEYIVYTQLSWRNKTFGKGSNFVWSSNSNVYAVTQTNGNVKLYKNFKEAKDFDQTEVIDFEPECLFGGYLLGVYGSSSLVFVDWDRYILVRRIEAEPKLVIWSEDGTHVAIMCETVFFVLSFDSNNYEEALRNNTIEEDGVEEAFELVAEINESAVNGRWIGNCFLYTTATQKLNYLIGTHTSTVAQFSEDIFLLGYLVKENKVYMMNKSFEIIHYALSSSVLEYQLLVYQQNMKQAEAMKDSIPENDRNKVARFLEAQGLKLEAVEMSKDSDHKFDIALGLGRMDIALEICKETNSSSKWNSLGAKALELWDLELAIQCFEEAGALSNLFMIYDALGDYHNIEKLAERALEKGERNIAFLCYVHLGNPQKLIDMLLEEKRTQQAAILAYSCLPERVAGLVEKWKEELKELKLEDYANSLIDPTSS